jgi:hypothetical protein
MTAYQVVLVAKFLAVMGFAGGAIAAFVAAEPHARKHAVHRVASPSLFTTWILGYALLFLGGLPFFEFWVLGSLVLSILANGALVYAVARERRDLSAFLLVALPVVGIVVLMVLKPTWPGVFP